MTNCDNIIDGFNKTTIVISLIMLKSKFLYLENKVMLTISEAFIFIFSGFHNKGHAYLICNTDDMLRFLQL